MTQSEAKLRLIVEYSKWLREVWEPENAGKHLTDYQRKTEERGWQLFSYPTNEKPNLLQFRHAASDPWQHPIKSWIIEHERERDYIHSLKM